MRVERRWKKRRFRPSHKTHSVIRFQFGLNLLVRISGQISAEAIFSLQKLDLSVRRKTVDIPQTPELTFKINLHGNIRRLQNRKE